MQKNVKFRALDPQNSHPHCKFLATRLEEIITRTREKEDSARDIRQQFQAIEDSGFPLPISTLLREALVSVKKGKFMFSPEQLSRVVEMIMEKSLTYCFVLKAIQNTTLFSSFGPQVLTTAPVVSSKTQQ